MKTLLSLLFLGLAGCGEAPRGRTVLLISLDSVRADALDFDDLNAVPYLAELARTGQVFDQAISSSSWTLPAHATLFTGAPAPLHGVQFDDIAIDPNHATLPELLKDDGWATAGWWTGWYTAGDYGFARGFDSYSNAMTGGRQIEAQYRDALARKDFKGAQQVLAKRDMAGHRDRTSQHVADGLRTALEDTDPGRDLFLFAHLFDPHYDYIPPPPFDTQFDPDYTGSMDGRDFYLNPLVFDPQARSRQIGKRDLEHIRALYQGEIAYADQQIGRMLAALKAAGRLDDALVIVTADHGEEFFEHGGRGHRASLYDEVLRVPLLVRDPRRQQDASAGPQHIQTQVGLLDVMPTILGFAGIEAPETSTGIDLAAESPLPSRPVFSSLMQHDPRRGYRFTESVRTPEEKLIRTYTFDPAAPKSLRLVHAQLFDLTQDSKELHSKADRDSVTTTSLWSAFEGELVPMRQRWHAAQGTRPEGRVTQVSQLFASDLAALGYSEGVAAPQPLSPSLALPWPPGPRPAPIE